MDWDNGEWLDFDSAWWNKGGDSWNLGGEAEEEVGEDLRLSTEVVKLEATEAAWVEAATAAVMMADVDVPPPVPTPWFGNELDCTGTPKYYKYRN